MFLGGPFRNPGSILGIMVGVRTRYERKEGTRGQASICKLEGRRGNRAEARQRRPCRAPSHQSYSTSSSTSYMTNRPRSGHAASSPNHGSCGREVTSSVTSNLTTWNTRSNRGWSYFQILQTPLLTTHTVSPFPIFRPPSTWVWVLMV